LRNLSDVGTTLTNLGVDRHIVHFGTVRLSRRRVLHHIMTDERLRAYADGKWAAAFAPRARGELRYWLVKSEPGVFSFDDLLRARGKRTHWDGIRNFTARNFLRDGMKVGDKVFFYHSSTEPQAIVGVCEVVREGYPDPTAFDPKHAQYDEGSDANDPKWYMVDLKAEERLPRPVTLAEIRARKDLADMALLRVGRLSVTPVTKKEWDTIWAIAAS
jgi:predicted RNA-binding protein with PUA-like domain